MGPGWGRGSPSLALGPVSVTDAPAAWCHELESGPGTPEDSCLASRHPHSPIRVLREELHRRQPSTLDSWTATTQSQKHPHAPTMPSDIAQNHPSENQCWELLFARLLVNPVCPVEEGVDTATAAVMGPSVEEG